MNFALPLNSTLPRRANHWLVASAVLASSTLAFAAPASAPFKSKQGYTIVPPSGLQKIPSPSPQMDVMFANRNGTSMNIIVTKVPVATSLTASPNPARTKMKGTLAKFKILKESSMNLNGTPAFGIASTFETGTPPTPVRLLSVLAIRGGKAYAFSCGGPNSIYPRYDAAFKKSLASLRWTK